LTMSTSTVVMISNVQYTWVLDLLTCVITEVDHFYCGAILKRTELGSEVFAPLHLAYFAIDMERTPRAGFIPVRVFVAFHKEVSKPRIEQVFVCYKCGARFLLLQLGI